MKIIIISSKHFYHKIQPIKEELEKQGHIIMLPNSFDAPFKEEEMKTVSPEEHSNWKRNMMKLHEPKISQNDAVLVLNFEKNNQPNYIGGATFMEVVKAWELNKKIFFYNPIPENIFTDELKGINPIIINQDLSQIVPGRGGGWRAGENIEVEIRSFISKEKYEELLEFFNKNAEKINEDYQETLYFNSNEDLRTQKNNSYSKIWLKKGKIHDDAREEIEIKFSKEDFEKINKILESIGLSTNIKWFRNRNEFKWNGITVCLDYTKGYGYIIEIEKITSEQEKETVLKELKQKLEQLNIPLTSKEEFNNKFEYYKQNWKELTR